MEAGLFIASASDIVLAKEGCFFQMPGVHLDILIGNAHLQRLLPAPVVREMVLTGKKLQLKKSFILEVLAKSLKIKMQCKSMQKKLLVKLIHSTPDQLQH